MSWKVKLALRWLALGWFGLLAVVLIAVAVYATIDNPWLMVEIIGLFAGGACTFVASLILLEWWAGRGKG